MEVGTAEVDVKLRGNYTGTLHTSYLITKGAQSITIGNRKTEVLLGDAPFNLNAVSPADSALSYKSSNPEAANQDNLPPHMFPRGSSVLETHSAVWHDP